MVGRPRHRARLTAAMTAMGMDPPEKKDWRPASGIPSKAQLAQAARERSDPTSAGDGGDAPFVAILGGIRADELDVESQAQFDALRRLAFAFAQEVMELPLNPGDKNFAKILSVKQAIATALLTATVRVRPGDLRDKDDDGVANLLDEVRAAEGDERPLTAAEMLG